MRIKRWLSVFAVLFVLFALFCIYLIVLSYTKLTVREYEIPVSGLETPVKFAVLADLHCNTFGEENSELIAAVKAQSPDGILLAGDLLNRHAKSHRDVIALVKALTEIAPVYSSVGNHEVDYLAQNGEAFLREMKAAGAVLLDRSYTEAVLGGQTVRIGGLYDYPFAADGFDSCRKETMAPAVYNFLTDFQQTALPKVMIAHRPEGYILGESSVTWEIDAVVSGHYHGGQIVLPFLGGIWAAEQGLFPDYLHGVYQKDKIQLFITSGLGSGSKLISRFNNPPELAVLTLVPEP